jgi:hypothetical protein
MLKTLWITFCVIAGAAIGAGLLGGLTSSAPLAIIGAVAGAVLGWLFGRYVPMIDALADMLG